MPNKNLTLGLCLVLSGSALAHNQTYRIKEGDTLSGIAERFHVRTHAIVTANDLNGHKALKVGRVLIIPSTAKSSDRVSSVHVPSTKGGHVVRSGENDVLIAKHASLSLHQLHVLNPGVKWQALQLGQVIRVSAGKAHAEIKVAKKAAKQISSSANYTVRDGENDWIIAHHHGITTVALKRLNPGLNLARLRAGQKIRVPASAVARVSTPKLHSRYAVVNGDSVSIRRHPSTEAEVVTRVDAGTRVAVLDRDGSWYRLRFPKGTEGWVRGDLLKAAAAPIAEHHHRRHVEEPEVRVAKRSHHSERVASRRHHSTSEHGYTERMVSFEKSSAGKGDPDEILKKAESFRGVRYRWGAMSRSATDCSGFTSQVFKSNGYKIPRTSREQAEAGIPVHSKDLKKGDLVFFHTMRGARVTHVGIYIGGGKFIHASSGGGKVQVNSLNDGYYHKRLVGARRVAKGTVAKRSEGEAKPKVDTTATAPDTTGASTNGDEK